LVIFDGKSGILELVAEYVENPKSQELRIFRRLMDVLPTLIADVPFIEIEEEDEEEREDDNDY